MATFDPATGSIDGTISPKRYINADDLALAADAPVASWADRATGGGALTQGNASRQPLYKTGVFGTKPGVLFDGTDDFLSGSATSHAYGTVILAFKPTADITRTTSVKQPLVHGFPGGGLVQGWALGSSSGGLSNEIAQFSSSNGQRSAWSGASASEAFESTATNVLTTSWDSTNARYAIFDNGSTDKTSQVNGTPSLTSQAGLTLGASPNAEFAYGGHIGVALVYSEVLTAAQRAAVHSWLQDEWGATAADYDAGWSGGGGEAKTTTGTVTLNLSATGTAQKHSASTTPLPLGIIAAGGDEKAGATSAPLTFALDVSGGVVKAGASNTTLPVVTALTGATVKTEDVDGATSTTIVLTVAADGTVTKATTTAATVGFGLALAGTVVKHQAGATNAPIGLALGITGTVARHSATTASLPLSLAVAGTIPAEFPPIPDDATLTTVPALTAHLSTVPAAPAALTTVVGGYTVPATGLGSVALGTGPLGGGTPEGQGRGEPAQLTGVTVVVATLTGLDVTAATVSTVPASGATLMGLDVAAAELTTLEDAWR